MYDDGPPLMNDEEDGGAEEQKEGEDDPLRNLGQTPMNTEEIQNQRQLGQKMQSEIDEEAL